MSAVLTAEQALKLVGEMFVYHMPFNRALGWNWSVTKKSSHSWPLKISR
ncbi:thioesterase family protein [Escherichia coli]|uniref:Thioesterase family protein n=1 Tax=Escherichia coli TaxID=562 RepID=A0A376Q1Y2_ECOLX|nr:thioesterase family protein [Escherichia coli]